MIPLILSASSIGSAAQQVLVNETTASVLGSISKGIYLLAPGQRVIFISFEVYRGPLTITLARKVPRLPEIKAGEQVKISPESIDWMDEKLSLLLLGAEIWSASKAQEIKEPDAGYFARLLQIASRMAACKDQLGFAPLLLPILGITKANLLSAELAPVWEKLKGLLEDGPNLTPAMIFDPLSSLMGYGRGLTPSGDDFITGFLLASVRWGNGLSVLGQALSQAAYQKTTTLSANLIECAANGQADERLIQVLDALASGNVALQACADLLSGYGNSSGADVLAGIALAARLRTYARPKN